ncbi:hypothetical protein AAFC00_005514 [Neodothiora populina]|uniref:Pectinesterase n=1 Tax=Neodothiora populina TaxID=2781224 RepID=A0ABR3PLG1_9PEZI
MLFKAAFVLLNLGLAFAAPTPAKAAAKSVRTSAPSGALVVGSGGKYTKIQDAVNALSTSSTTAQSIFIEPGTYNEQVYIPSRKAELTIYGYTTDTSSYENNKVTITHAIAYKDVTTDDLTATLRVWTENFKMYNVNVANTVGAAGHQALALSAYKGNQGYYGCKFTGFQDTILAQSGAQLYSKCYIEGATDFIFGQHAQAWFTGCDIRLAEATLGYVTASGRPSSSDGSYYVIDSSNIAAASGATIKKGAFYLGRPWAAYARVIVQNTSMTDAINSAGWAEWNPTTPNTADATFEEYNNSGAGSEGTRASFSKKISKAIAITTVLGSNYASASYVDSSYL